MSDSIKTYALVIDERTGAARMEDRPNGAYVEYWSHAAEIETLRAQLAASADEQNRLNAVAHDQFMQLAAKDAELAKLKLTLHKINDIRNSIIGFQALNWSEHAYPLVAALNAAGIQGMDFPEARIKFKLICDELAETHAELAQCRQDAEIGAAVNRACEALPARTLIEITLEQGAGIVRLFLPDTDAQLDEFEHEADTFGGQINAAIDAAISQSTQQPEQQ